MLIPEEPYIQLCRSLIPVSILHNFSSTNLKNTRDDIVYMQILTIEGQLTKKLGIAELQTFARSYPTHPISFFAFPCPVPQPPKKISFWMFQRHKTVKNIDLRPSTIQTQLIPI